MRHRITTEFLGFGVVHTIGTQSHMYITQQDIKLEVRFFFSVNVLFDVVF